VFDDPTADGRSLKNSPALIIPAVVGQWSTVTGKQ